MSRTDADGVAVRPQADREAIIRAAVAAMPNCNPGVADDLIQGHTMHTEADDILAIWQAASGVALPDQPVTEGAAPCPAGRTKAEATVSVSNVPDRVTPAYSCANAAQQKGRCSHWCGTCLRSTP